MRSRPALVCGLALAAAAVVAGAPVSAAPDRVENFALHDQHGRFHELHYHTDAAAIVLFVWGNGCPIARKAMPELRAIRDAYAERGVRFLLLDANLQDDRASVAAEAREFGIDFPILIDETQLVARGLGIERTAEVLVVDPKTWRLVYRGPIDDRLHYESERPASELFLRDALDAHLDGRPVAEARRDAPGCLIVFRNGAEPISYAETVAPILKSRCRVCHHPGGVAPWSMTSYDQVFGWSAMMREVIRTRRMPPWQADPHGPRFRNDLRLPTQEARALVDWIEAGALRGEGPDPLADEPLAEPPEWPLGEPDLVLETRRQKIKARGIVDYRYETLKVPLDRDVWVRGIDIRPSNAKVMHHGTVYALPKGRRSRDETLGPDFVEGLMGGYVPGRIPSFYPAGTGFRLPKGSKIRFELHYNTTGRRETDRPRVALYLTDEPVARELKIGAAANFQFYIPPRAREHEVVAERTVDRDILIYRLTPHMHYRGRSMSFEARYPDGTSELLLSVPSYDFNWQHYYTLVKPKRVPAGTTIAVRAVFDNSEQNRANPNPRRGIRFGLQSTDEMMIGYFFYAEADAAQDAVAAR